jgi:hypothetical protein
MYTRMIHWTMDDLVRFSYQMRFVNLNNFLSNPLLKHPKFLQHFNNQLEDSIMNKLISFWLFPSTSNV